MLLAIATTTATVATSRGEQVLTVYPPSRASAPPASRPLVLVLSGEGGWREFDDKLATWLSSEGYWVGGIDCLKYFWKPQDDRSALAMDVGRYARALTAAAGGTKNARFVLAGFSFGADLAPWVAGADGRAFDVAAMVLIGPDLKGSLEARVTEILGFAPKAHTFDTAGALTDAHAVPVLFVHGGKDENSAAPKLAAAFPGKKALAVIPGASHHFAGHEDELKRAIVDGIEQLLSR
jgi:type IV secretory pathway VirJ component